LNREATTDGRSQVEGTSIVADGPVATEALWEDSMASIIGTSASKVNLFVASFFA